MDKDVSVEPELDGFSRILPLPYRVAAVIVFGEWFSPGVQSKSQLVRFDPRGAGRLKCKSLETHQCALPHLLKASRRVAADCLQASGHGG